MHDLIIIGAGSAGIATARRATSHNLRVLLIESRLLGGTCVNVGCVPKKMTYNLAMLAEHIKLGRSYNLISKCEGLDYARFVQARDAYIHKLNGVYENLLRKDNVELVSGYGELYDGYVMVGDVRYEYRKCVLATGAEPTPLLISSNKEKDSKEDYGMGNSKEDNGKDDNSKEKDGKEKDGKKDKEEGNNRRDMNGKEDISKEDNEDDNSNNNKVNKNEINCRDDISKKDNENIYRRYGRYPVKGSHLLKTSDHFFSLNNIPKRSVIVGSGYIATELSFILAEFGCEVHLVARGNKILSHFDDVIGENVLKSMEKKGIKVYFNSEINEITESSKSKENEMSKSNRSNTESEHINTDNITHVDFRINDSTIITDVDFPMCCVGRDCNLDYIKVPIKSKSNFLVVDGNFMTSIPNVYAIGDLIGPEYMLTPVAIHCGRILAQYLSDIIKNSNVNGLMSNDLVNNDLMDNDLMDNEGVRMVKENFVDVVKENTIQDVYKNITGEEMSNNEHINTNPNNTNNTNSNNGDRSNSGNINNNINNNNNNSNSNTIDNNTNNNSNINNSNTIDNLTLVDKHDIFKYVPSVIFSHPPCASIGHKESDVRKMKGEMKVYKSSFVNLLYSLEDDDKERSVFKIVTLDSAVVGLHMFGTGCDEIVQGFAVAMKMGAKYADFERTIGVHPTAAEEVVTMKESE